MGPGPHSEPDEQYRRWLEALARAMSSPNPSRPEPESKQAPPAGLLGWNSVGPDHSPNDFFRKPREDLGLKKSTLPAVAPPPGCFSSPRIWDLWKPYVLVVGIVLVVGMTAIGSLKWLTLWWIPPTRPSVPSAPIDAQWDVRRRGLHILPDPEMSPQPASPSSEQSASNPVESETSLSKGEPSESASLEKP